MFDFTKYRNLFLATERFVYFNHASTGPLPTTAVEAIASLANRYSKQGNIDWAEDEALSNEVRALAAKLVNSSPDEICFVQNTSQGVIIAIGSIPFEKGDNIILMRDAFPTNTAPFHYLLPEIEKRYVTSAELLDNPQSILTKIDKHTKAISLDWVNFLNGIRIDMAIVSKICEERGIYFIVDGMQGLGALTLDLSKIKIDFFSSAAPKWLLGPHGIGILYVNKNILTKLRPFNLGWLSVEWDNFYDIFTPRPLKTTAARFEEGTKNYLGIIGLREALKLFIEIRTDKIESQILDLAGYLINKINNPKFEIITPLERNKRAGIVSFKKKDADNMELFKKLKQNNIICSFREGYIRISPHFYNTTVELDRLVKIVSNA